MISKRFGEELQNKEMRDAFLISQLRTYISRQIRAIRKDRDWSQSELAQKASKPQSAISSYENREYGSYNVSTLAELASAYDVGLIVEFVEYDEFLRRTSNLTDSHLVVAPFSAERISALTDSQRQKVSVNRTGGAVVDAPITYAPKTNRTPIAEMKTNNRAFYVNA